jgi:hypothetical protein
MDRLLKRNILNVYSVVLAIILSGFLFLRFDAPISLRFLIIAAVLLFIQVAVRADYILQTSGPLPYVLVCILTFCIVWLLYTYLLKPGTPIVVIIALFLLLIMMNVRPKIVALVWFSFLSSFIVAEICFSPGGLECNTNYTVVAISGKSVGPDQDYAVLEGLLGYRPISNAKILGVHSCGKKEIYRTIYTTDSQGHRITGAERVNGLPVLVFGDSFAYGEGVNDDQNLPAMLEKISQGRYRTYNFAFSGYGPHQTYTILKNNLETKAIGQQRPAFAIYFAFFDLERASGRSGTHLYGPRYELNQIKRLEYKGPFYSSFMKRLQFQFEKSFLFHRVIERIFFDKYDKELFVELLRRSVELIRSRYGSECYVLLWESTHPFYGPTLSRLRWHGLKTYGTLDMFSDYADNYKKYYIENDGYPTPLGYSKIAKFLLKKISSGH